MPHPAVKTEWTHEGSIEVYTVVVDFDTQAATDSKNSDDAT